MEPAGVQGHNIPNFKGLIVHHLDSWSSRAWQHFYLPPRPVIKVHFIEKKGQGGDIHFPKLYMDLNVASFCDQNIFKLVLKLELCNDE